MEEQKKLIEEATYHVQEALSCAEIMYHSYEELRLRKAIEVLNKLEVSINSKQLS